MSEQRMMIDWPPGGANELAEQLGSDQKARCWRELLCDPVTNRCALASRQDVEWYERSIAMGSEGKVLEEMGDMTMKEFGIRLKAKCGAQPNALARLENDGEGRLGFRVNIYSGKSEVGTGFDLEDLGQAAAEALDSVGKPDQFVTIKR